MSPLSGHFLFPQREMDTLLATILDDGHNLVGAAKCSLFFVDEDKKELWTKVATDNDGEIKVRGAAQRCAWLARIFLRGSISTNSASRRLRPFFSSALLPSQYAHLHRWSIVS